MKRVMCALRNQTLPFCHFTRFFYIPRVMKGGVKLGFVNLIVKSKGNRRDIFFVVGNARFVIVTSWKKIGIRGGKTTKAKKFKME